MKKLITLTAVLTAAGILAAGSAMAATTGNVPVQINVNVGAFAKLTIPNAISFNNADPDLGAVAANENPVSVRAKVRTGSTDTANLTVQAVGDLVSATGTIGIGAIAWTATGAGFSPGTMTTVAQTAGSWTGSGDRSGTFRYSFDNLWTYAPGSYTATVNYVLSAP